MGSNPSQKRQAISETIDFDKTIHTIRGQRVMLDSDMAKLFGVPTKRVNEAAKRNLEGFPEQFMFQLTRQELTNLKSQIAALEKGRGKHPNDGFIRLQFVLSTPVMTNYTQS